MKDTDQLSLPHIPEAVETPVKPKKLTTIHLYFEIDDYYTAEGFWPDGDAPENPTIDDVLAVIKKCGGPRRMLDDWNMYDGASMGVTLDGETPGHAVVDYDGKTLQRSKAPA